MSKLLDALILLGVLPVLRKCNPPEESAEGFLEENCVDNTPSLKETYSLDSLSPVRETHTELASDKHVKRKKTPQEKKQKRCRAIKKKSRKRNRKEKR